jgi:hypothetical protein
MGYVTNVILIFVVVGGGFYCIFEFGILDSRILESGTSYDEVIDVKSNPASEFERGEQAIISGMGYTVTSVTVTNSLPALGLNAGSGEKVVYAKYKVKNLSNDPKKEQQGFSLKDSSGKRFTGYYVAEAFGDSVFDKIQPGMSGKSLRMAVFLIPFDPELEYKLTGGNIIINLGKGNSFNFK